MTAYEDLILRISDGIPNLGELDHEPLCAITYDRNPHCNCLVFKTKDARLALAQLVVYISEETGVENQGG